MHLDATYKTHRNLNFWLLKANHWWLIEIDKSPHAALKFIGSFHLVCWFMRLKRCTHVNKACLTAFNDLSSINSFVHRSNFSLWVLINCAEQFCWHANEKVEKCHCWHHAASRHSSERKYKHEKAELRLQYCLIVYMIKSKKNPRDFSLHRFIPLVYSLISYAI